MLTWREPPAWRELGRRVYRERKLHRRAWLSAMLLLLFCVIVPVMLSLMGLYMLPPDKATAEVWRECIMLVSVLIVLGGGVVLVGVIVSRLRLLQRGRWYQRGRTHWLECGTVRRNCKRIREYQPLQIAFDQYNLYAMRISMRVGTMNVIGLPNAATAARLDELCAAAGVPRAEPLQVRSFDELANMYHAIEAANVQGNMAQKHPWKYLLLIVTALASMILVFRALALVAFMNLQQPAPAVAAALLVRYDTEVNANNTCTTAHAFFQIDTTSAINVTTHTNGSVVISAPPAEIRMTAVHTVAQHTNYVAYAPWVLTAVLEPGDPLLAAGTNILTTLYDDLQMAWRVPPAPFWRMVVMSRQAFWAHVQLMSSRGLEQPADAITVVRTPDVNGIMYETWEGGTARVARVFLQDHTRSAGIMAHVRVPFTHREQFPQILESFASSFQFRNSSVHD